MKARDLQAQQCKLEEFLRILTRYDYPEDFDLQFAFDCFNPYEHNYLTFDYMQQAFYFRDPSATIEWGKCPWQRQ